MLFILDSRYWINSGLLVFGTWIPDTNHKQDSGLLGLNSGFQSPRFQIPWFQILQAKNSPGLESRLPYAGLFLCYFFAEQRTHLSLSFSFFFFSARIASIITLPVTTKKILVNPFNPKCSQVYSMHSTLPIALLVRICLTVKTFFPCWWFCFISFESIGNVLKLGRVITSKEKSNVGHLVIQKSWSVKFKTIII